MKNLTLLLILLTAFQGAIFPQSCLPEGITFETQSQIDSFQVNYPNCTEIEGDVSIWFYNPTDITNLNGLNILTHIGGSLWIGNNYLLTTLTGLNNLNTIGGDLHVGFGYDIWDDSPTYLTSLTGLENLISIGGGLSIAFNHNLTSLTGLENLTFIGSNLEIKYNDVLTSLNALENMEADSMSDITIFNNPLLDDCEAQSICDYLDSLSGTVNIYNNATGCNNPQEVASNCSITLPCLPYGNYYFLSQADIDNFQSYFPNCTELQGNVTIEGNGITTLNGLNNLTSIQGHFIMQGNSSLTSLMGLENLNSIGLSIQILNNDGLTNLSGLEGLSSVGGWFTLWYNSNLTNLTGLEGLTSIGESLQITRNSSLCTLTGLEQLNFIGDDLDINDNWYLTSLIGLNNLTSIQGGLFIASNYSLINLTGLDGLTTIGGWLHMRYNDDLISLTGLENLTSIGGYLYIGEPYGGNPVLVDISALSGLTSIGGGLMVNHNNALNSLTGLDNIEAGTITDLTICNNSSLTTCEVQSICDYLASPYGIIEIHDNATECNSQEEVDTSCATIQVKDIIPKNVSFIYPNPTSTTITIETPATSYKNTFINIFNISGKRLLQRQMTEQQTVVDVSGLVQGVYFVRITTDATVLVTKFIKQ